jgi:hypothetical protein
VLLAPVGSIAEAAHGSVPPGPRAQHEHATLVSVVQPAPRSSSISGIGAVAGPRRHAGVFLSAAAAILALAGSLAWSQWTPSESPQTGAARLSAGVQASPAALSSPGSRSEAPQARGAEDLPIVTPASLPVAPQRERTAAAYHKAPAKAAADAKNALPAKGAKPAALPQALPARDPALDLMEPY